MSKLPTVSVTSLYNAFLTREKPSIVVVDVACGSVSIPNSVVVDPQSLTPDALTVLSSYVSGKSVVLVNGDGEADLSSISNSMVVALVEELGRRAASVSILEGGLTAFVAKYGYACKDARSSALGDEFVPPPYEISPQLYVGNGKHASNRDLVSRAGITHMFCLNEPSSSTSQSDSVIPTHPNVEVHLYPLADDGSPIQVSPIVEALTRILSSGGKVLVYCRASRGYDRRLSVVFGLLLTTSTGLGFSPSHVDRYVNLVRSGPLSTEASTGAVYDSDRFWTEVGMIEEDLAHFRNNFSLSAAAPGATSKVPAEDIVPIGFSGSANAGKARDKIFDLGTNNGGLGAKDKESLNALAEYLLSKEIGSSVRVAMSSADIVTSHLPTCQRLLKWPLPDLFPVLDLLRGLVVSLSEEGPGPCESGLRTILTSVLDLEEERMGPDGGYPHLTHALVLKTLVNYTAVAFSSLPALDDCANEWRRLVAASRQGIFVRAAAVSHRRAAATLVHNLCLLCAARHKVMWPADTTAHLTARTVLVDTALQLARGEEDEEVLLRCLKGVYFLCFVGGSARSLTTVVAAVRDEDFGSVLAWAETGGRSSGSSGSSAQALSTLVSVLKEALLT